MLDTGDMKRSQILSLPLSRLLKIGEAVPLTGNAKVMCWCCGRRGISENVSQGFIAWLIWATKKEERERMFLIVVISVK